jgi:hypothetical protein
MQSAWHVNVCNPAGFLTSTNAIEPSGMDGIEKDIETNKKRLDAGQKDLDRFTSAVRQQTAEVKRRRGERETELKTQKNSAK